MAASATIRGRFAARTRKSWKEFEDREGKVVAAGASLALWVVTDGDDEINKVRVGQDDFERACQATDMLKFGDRIELAVSVDQYGVKYIDRVLVDAKS